MSVFSLGLTPPAAVSAQTPAQPAVASGSESSGTVKLRIEDFYSGAKKRDPFTMVGGGGSAPAGEKKEFNLETIDLNDFVRKVVLKGLVRDKTGALALLVDPETETGLILRGGRLYDYKRNWIKGILGQVNMAQKTVKLTSPDKEVRILRLGEDEESDDDAGPKKGRGDSP